MQQPGGEGDVSESDMKEVFRLGAAVGERLKARGETVAVAESSAGGLIAAALLAVPGASAYFRGGAVIYNRTSIRELTGLDMKLLMAEGIRSSSEPFAAKLAEAMRQRLRADWGLAETGAAGPTGNSYGDEAGHSCTAVAGEATAARTLETGAADRMANMARFAAAALRQLLERLD